MPAVGEVPAAILEAFDDLNKADAIEIVQELRLANDKRNMGDAEFVCRVDLPYPNKENLPRQVELRFEIPASFPLAQIDVYPVGDAVRGFPHQDAETGKLCLQPNTTAPWDATRLKCYFDWAVEWLRDAAQGGVRRVLKLGHGWLERVDQGRKRAARSQVTEGAADQHAELRVVVVQQWSQLERDFVSLKAARAELSNRSRDSARLRIGELREEGGTPLSNPLQLLVVPPLPKLGLPGEGARTHPA